MREVVITRHGPPEVMQVRERPDPVPGPGEVRIRVRACGVNFADLLARMGLYPDAPRPPLVAGYEVAGTVDAVGVGVAPRLQGERVIALSRFGGYADTVTVPADQTFAAPLDLSDAEAAAIPVNYLTAFLALYRLANLAPHETVLIYSAAGGVGVAATQLARLRRATIIGTASVSKHGALGSFGVDHPLDSRHPHLEDEIRRLTGNRGVDIVLDTIGGSSFARSYRLLAPLGRLVMLGMSELVADERRNWIRTLRVMMATPRFHPLSLINRNRAIMGLHLNHLWHERRQLAPAMHTLLADIAADRLHPIVARTFPLERAADAHRFIQSRANIGKVVLTT